MPLPPPLLLLMVLMARWAEGAAAHRVGLRARPEARAASGA